MKGDRMTDLLDRTQQEMAARLKELEPAVEEFKQLQAAAAALGGLIATSPAPPRSAQGTSATAKRRGGRPRGSTNRASKAAPAPAAVAPAAKSARASMSRRGAPRPKVGGTRAIQALSLIAEQPGITIADLAKTMGVNRSNLYRVLPGLELEGRLSRRGSGWHPAGS
jgi:CRP-like cAMP-binding protein